MKALSFMAVAQNTCRLVSALLVGTVSALAVLPFYSSVAYSSSPQTFYAHSENRGYEASDNKMDQATPEPTSATYDITPTGTGDFQIPGNNTSGGRYFTAAWPSPETITSDTWTFHTWIKKSGGTSTYYVKVFKNADTTALFTSSSAAITSDWAETDTTGSAPGISMSAGDRLRFEYWVNVTTNDSQIKNPTGDGDSTGTWSVTPSSPTTRYDKVDETSADDTDYITGTAVGRSLFTFSAFSVPSGSTIENLTIYYRASEGTSGNNKIGASLKIGGTAYDNATQQNPGTSWTTYSQAYTTNPATSSAWTVGDINGTGSNPLQQFGVRSSDVSPNPRVSQCYAVVTFRPPISLRIDDNATPDISTRVDTTVAIIVPILSYPLLALGTLFFIFLAVRRKVLVLHREVAA